MTKAFARLAVIDSRRWIAFLLNLLPRLDDVDFATLSDAEKRMLQMFYVTIWSKAAEDWNSEEVLDNLYALSDSTIMLSELTTLLRYQYEHIDFIDRPVDLGFACPLDLHCTYTRDQLLVAMDFLKPATVRELKTDSLTGGAGAYTYLGTATYVKHEGSRPMNITWKLDQPIPAKFLKKTNKLVVG